MMMTRLEHIFLQGSLLAAPAMLAVTDASESYTYAELAACRARIALLLQAQQLQSPDRVGLWLDKSCRALAAMLAVSAVGGCYVPIDPLNPPGRVSNIVSDCQMRLLITTEARYRQCLAIGLTGLTYLLIDSQPHQQYPADVLTWQQLDKFDSHTFQQPFAQDEDALAYILYTSGSTGLPKGVCISHGNALAFILWSQQCLQPHMSDRFANHAPWHFDLSVLDIYLSLLTGASLYLVPEMVSYLPEQLAGFIARHQLTIWYSVPTALALMVDRVADFSSKVSSLRHIIFAGEPFEIKALQRLRAALPMVALYNFYGPTETNVCIAYQVPAEVPPLLPVGQSASGAVIRILAEDGTAVLTGQHGFITVSGPSVFSRYWGSIARTEVYYNTGDIGYQDANGDIVFVGRQDHQVKVRGYRVHLAEVERVIYLHPVIRECLVLLGEDEKLHAYIATDGEAPTLLALKLHCARWLPKYMLPDQVHIAASLPRNRNGKLSRQALLDQQGL